MHWTCNLPARKINEWRRVHHLKLSKIPACTCKEFYRRGWLFPAIFGTDWFSRVYISFSNCTLMLRIQTCGVQGTYYSCWGPTESRSSIDFFLVNPLFTEKGGLLWATHKGELHRNHSLLKRETVTYATRGWFQGFKVFTRRELEKQSLSTVYWHILKLILCLGFLCLCISIRKK